MYKFGQFWQFFCVRSTYHLCVNSILQFLHMYLNNERSTFEIKCDFVNSVNCFSMVWIGSTSLTESKRFQNKALFVQKVVPVRIGRNDFGWNNKGLFSTQLLWVNFWTFLHTLVDISVIAFNILCVMQISILYF